MSDLSENGADLSSHSDERMAKGSGEPMNPKMIDYYSSDQGGINR